MFLSSGGVLFYFLSAPSSIDEGLIPPGHDALFFSFSCLGLGYRHIQSAKASHATKKPSSVQKEQPHSHPRRLELARFNLVRGSLRRRALVARGPRIPSRKAPPSRRRAVLFLSLFCFLHFSVESHTAHDPLSYEPAASSRELARGEGRGRERAAARRRLGRRALRAAAARELLR